MKFPLLAASFDITSACNLDCRHCYIEKRSDYDLDEEGWLRKIKEIKSRNPLLSHAIWLGGEPLLRKKLLAGLMGQFRYNSVFTNGTIPFEGLPSNCAIQISVDGTEKIHDYVRGTGSFRKTVANIAASARRKITIAVTVNKVNRNCLEEMADFFFHFAPVRILGIHFIFHTKRDSSDALGLSFEERDEVFGRILEMKKLYGDFVLATPHMREILRDQKRMVRLCPFKTRTMRAYDSKCVGKEPCWYGQDLCGNCGCSIAFEASLSNVWNFESIRQTYRIFTNFPNETAVQGNIRSGFTGNTLV